MSWMIDSMVFPTQKNWNEVDILLAEPLEKSKKKSPSEEYENMFIDSSSRISGGCNTPRSNYTNELADYCNNLNSFSEGYDNTKRSFETEITDNASTCYYDSFQECEISNAPFLQETTSGSEEENCQENIVSKYLEKHTVLKHGKKSLLKSTIESVEKCNVTRKVAQSIVLLSIDKEKHKTDNNSSVRETRADSHVFTGYDVNEENHSRRKHERKKNGQTPSNQAIGKKSKKCVLSRNNVQTYLDKRMRNNLASKKSRELRRLRLEETDKKIDQLQKENEAMRNAVNLLLRRNKTINSILIDYDNPP